MNAWARNRRDGASRARAKLFAIYNERRFCGADACGRVSGEGPSSATMPDAHAVGISEGCRVGMCGGGAEGVGGGERGTGRRDGGGGDVGYLQRLAQGPDG